MGGKRWVRWVIRWAVAAALAAAAFALGWWVCDGLLHRDEAVSLAIAGAAAGIVMVIAGWWALLEPKGKESGVDGENSGAAPGAGAGGDRWTVEQDVTAEGDARVAGRDLDGSGPDSGGDTGTGHVKQTVEAGGDAEVAGRDLGGPGGGSGDTGDVTQRVTAGRNARVAGRDLRITQPRDK
jgi:hypothetical protein